MVGVTSSIDQRQFIFSCLMIKTVVMAGYGRFYINLKCKNVAKITLCLVAVWKELMFVAWGMLWKMT